MSSQTALSSRGSSKRLAPPTLFVRPPSRDATTAAELRVPQSAATPTQATSSRPTLQRQRSTTTPLPQRERKLSSTSATWAELQNTLEEVELNAGSSSNVFGPEHSRALEELRKAQVELARAWARGEGDDVAAWLEDVEGNVDREAGKDMDPHGGVLDTEKRDRTRRARSGMAGSAEDVAGSGSGSALGMNFRSGNSKLEEETENDIQLARKRRMANDRYFERVNKGVVDVVAKLEVVAKKMGGVEMESQEIWGERDSLDSEDIGRS